MVADPADRPDGLPHRTAAGQRHGPPRAAPRPAPDRRRSQRPDRGVGLGVGGGHHRLARSGSTGGGRTWLAFVLMGPMYARFAILMHESAHKLLFTNKRVNDWVGTWLVAYPTWTPISLYRRGPLRPPQGGVRPERAGHRLLRRLPLRPASAGPPPGPRRGGHLRVEELRPAVDLGADPRLPAGLALHPRGPGLLWALMWAATGTLVDLPAALVAPVDDPVAGDQPAPGHRRARRARGQPRPSGHHPQRAPALDRPVLVRPVQHRMAPGPPRRHGSALAEPAPFPRRAGAGRLRHRGDHLPRATSPSGGRSPRPERQVPAGRDRDGRRFRPGGRGAPGSW